MHKTSAVFVAGHGGLVGSAIVRKLRARGHANLICRTRAELDLMRQEEVAAFFRSSKPEYVFMAAAKVGGILANSLFPADFLQNNLLIQSNVIEAAYRHGTRKLLFLGSSCIYPKYCPQPIKEEYLLTGELEPTNDAYAIAKIAGIRMVQAYRSQYGFDGISLMPTNLYGPGDNFHLQTSHVLPALIEKFHSAKISGAKHVVLWGSGRPRREFLHVDDLADAAVFAMDNYSSAQILNVGAGRDIMILELAEMIRDIVGHPCEILLDASKPDGTPQKLLDVSRFSALGWNAKIALRDGIEQTYRWYLLNSEMPGIPRQVRPDPIATAAS